jgi:Flp pilus assembly protein TadD
LFQQGKIGEALPFLKQAVTGMPDNPVHRYHLGAAFLKSGNQVAGRKELETALRISGTFEGAAKARALLATQK